MGLFGNLFQRDPEKEVARIEDWLARDRPYKALEVAQRLARGAEGDGKVRADALVDRCRTSLVESILAHAEQAEEAGNPSDAADWLDSALGRLPPGDPRREAIESRRQRIQTELEAAEEDSWALRIEGGPGQERSPEFDEIGDDLRFETLVSMLEDDVSSLYEEQPEPFRQALVDLNEGRTREAAAALDELLAAKPDDPVLRLERGRCRLLTGEPTAAREDFEVAWESFGDEPIDLAATTALPELWAEASLAAGDADPVIERLADLAEPAEARPVLIEAYATALLAGGRSGEARSRLAAASSRHPSHAALTYLLAKALRADGDPELALDCLETVVAPTCATGRCGGQRRHLPSLRLLAELHLDLDAGEPERALELLTLVASDQGGRRSPEDLELLARYQEAAGEGEAATRLRHEAERLRASGETFTAADYRPPALGGGRRSVL